jgi:hypothetical protein
MIKPLCFVLMPFGKKKDPSRPRQPEINFNAIWKNGIEPAIRAAGMEPIRADEEETLGIIQKPMFERLLLCDFAVAELTLSNPNVFYELGVRHASRHNTTLPIFADHAKLAFDVALLRALPYHLGKNNEFGGKEAAQLRKALGERLKVLRELARKSDPTDSPVFQLVSKFQQSNLPADARLKRIKDTDGSLYELLNQYSGHEKTDIFREMVAYSGATKAQLAAARRKEKVKAIQALNRIRADLEPLDGIEAGVVVDLYLSYRAVEAWDEMISLYEAMPEVVKRSVLAREQLAFALNRRAGKEPNHPEYRDRAVEILNEVLKQIGPSPETCGLMGRVYKDQWRESLKTKREAEARGYLTRAIDAYVAGFTADWRDAYPGVNAVTLLEVEGSAKSFAKKDELLQVVKFAVNRRIATPEADYWDYATLVELEVLGGKPEDARQALDEALSRVREKWEPKTTAANLRYIYDARRSRGNAEWVLGIIDTLLAHAS